MIVFKTQNTKNIDKRYLCGQLFGMDIKYNSMDIKNNVQIR